MMKIIGGLAVVGAALVAMAAPAGAQHVRHTRTTVTRVHGPLKVLPHHNRKICRVTYRHGHRVRKCHYH